MAALRSWASLKQGYESKYAPRFKASLWPSCDWAKVCPKKLRYDQRLQGPLSSG